MSSYESPDMIPTGMLDGEPWDEIPRRQEEPLSLDRLSEIDRVEQAWDNFDYPRDLQPHASTLIKFANKP